LCSGLNWIIQFIQTMAQQPQDDCCNQLVAALTAINSSLGNIFTQLSALPSPAPPPDFTPLVNELTCLCTAARNYPAFVRDMVVYLGAQMAAVAKTIVPPIDLTPVSDALNKANALQDIPQALLDKLEADGAIPQGYGQFLIGGPHDIADILAKFNDWLGSKLGLGEHISSGIIDLKPAEAAVWNDAVIVISAVFRGIADYLGAPHDSFQGFLDWLFDKFIRADTVVVEPVVKYLVDKVISLLTPAGGATPTLGNVHVDPDRPVTVALTGTIAANVASYLASWAREGTGESLTKLVDLLGAAVGFEQLVDVLVGPYVQHGIKAVADMNARALFRQHIPQGSDVADWMARGLVTADFGKRLLNLDGFGDEIQPPTVLAAQRGLNPRMLLQLIVTGLFTADDLGDEMTFSGIRPASQDRLKLASPYLATAKFRDATRAAIEAAYVAGLLSDSDLTEQLDSIEHNTDRDNLILVGSKWKKLTAITKDLEAQYATLFEAGLLDDVTFHDHLTAIGLQDDVANAVAARSEARANAALQRRTIADARALAKATAAEERRAAVRSYVAGQIDLPALAVALTATGLTPIQAAAWSEIAQLQKTGTPRWIYGLRVPSEEATLLRSRVAALMDQRRRQLLSAPQFHDALASLGIPPEWINSLRATTDAMITPKAAAVLTPIVTNES